MLEIASIATVYERVGLCGRLEPPWPQSNAAYSDRL